MAGWRNNPVIAIVAVVVLALAVVLIVRRPMGPKVAYLVKCESCDKEFQAKLANDTLFPINCPSCGKKTVYRLTKMRCKACGHTFSKINKTMTPGTGSDNMAELQAATAVKCPNCGAAQGKLERVE